MTTKKLCTECLSPLDEEKLDSVTVTECAVCHLKQTVVEEQMTIVDEFPLDEYLGG